MKNIILLASVLGAFSVTFAQSVIGSYTQSALIAPDQIRAAAQTVGRYAVKLGCVIFDKEENEIAIALNNKSQCFGISQSDYDNVSVSKKGVNAGGVKVSSNGEISAGGTNVSKKGIEVDVKGALAGLQYVGKKN